ncbi:ATP-binding cassette sub-family G member 4-like, partial [Bacillus rossius redtenbacheri]|uniref:ATP-binding cassette sub-family G member 4-like n=1 Tax=Bacillus rossius redtenbacheri TaxID=93214 RepID=UPI002FDE9F83
RQDCSARRTRGVSGAVLTNGLPRQPRLFHKLSAYIQQEDLLQPRLTALEALQVAADLKLGRELTAPQRAAAVEELLGCMSLKECCDTRTERLSGGQRKRLSVALELVNNPPVIFLDEPTTGLDVVTMKKCIMFLKTLARQGRTIVCTVHQPSSSLFRQFDNVLVLARGRCVYHGSPGHVVHFLEAVDLPCPTSHNPADF